MSTYFPGIYAPFPNSFQSIAVTNGAVVTLTVPSSATFGHAKFALVQVLGANVNWRDDGGVPTTGAGGGMSLLGDSGPDGFLGNLLTAQFISTSGTGSTMLVSYYY